MAQQRMPIINGQAKISPWTWHHKVLSFFVSQCGLAYTALRTKHSAGLIPGGLQDASFSSSPGLFSYSA